MGLDARHYMNGTKPFLFPFLVDKMKGKRVSKSKDDFFDENEGPLEVGVLKGPKQTRLSTSKRNATEVSVDIETEKTKCIEDLIKMRNEVRR